jgi:uncharacterized protein YcbK (DUF882 family)
MKLSKNFSLAEFECRCRQRFVNADNTFCHGVAWPHPELVKVLQTIRDGFNEIVIVLSGCRCPSYNKMVGGTGRSFHIRGLAADIAVSRYSAYAVYNEIVRADYGASGIIGYDTFVHVDIRAIYGFPRYISNNSKSTPPGQ